MEQQVKSFWDDAPVISVYTQEQAIADGLLVKVGQCGKYPVIFTSNLLSDGFEDTEKRTALVQKGLALLQKPDEEDTEDMKLRVLEKDKIWVIADGNGITFMKPEDY